MPRHLPSIASALLLAAVLLAPDLALAAGYDDRISFGKANIAFFVLVGIVTGTVGWWRTMRGDGVVVVVLYCVVLIVGLCMFRFSPTVVIEALAEAYWSLAR